MMQPLFDLRGRVVLLTGATGGLGVAIAQAMAAHGATLLLSDHNAADCEALASLLRAHGHHADTLPCDLSQQDDVRQLAASALQHHGQIDVLVCNAGIQGPAGPLDAVSPQQWNTVMDINLRSAATLSALLMPAMAECGGGSVILMSSIAGLRGNKAIGLYGLSKAALAQLARNLAVEWGPRNVRVNAIAPGLIRTPLAASLLADQTFMTRRMAQTPLRRPGEPHEIAGVAVMLASAAGAFITGQTLVVDGGTTISDGN
ncbi:glucose 1-dehydrogenase [Duganella sp. FT135W]|uniref:Glucose 1-dehydrogenase n=1 Tax=Duganella flavida TaxID=2692175 RepID=A0A6L8K9U6_9BURK|nr:SDR family NAD(P)-dependent oxidoreductase [Duganella flavida]MYM22672.1 glucose 1-dehydrogenase [Duganella flavida]